MTDRTEQLKKFVCEIWAKYCDGQDLDSLDIFDLFVNYDFIRREMYDPQIHGTNFDGEPGDPIYFIKDEYKELT